MDRISTKVDHLTEFLLYNFGFKFDVQCLINLIFEILDMPLLRKSYRLLWEIKGWLLEDGNHFFIKLRQVGDMRTEILYCYQR